MLTIHCGDVTHQLNHLSGCGAETFDACLCDPPYGYAAFGHRETQQWEKEAVPVPHVWRSLESLLRPGALLMAATGAKTYDLICHDVRKAGFEILDMFPWMYTSSSSTGVREGYRLKPVFEPYVLARKPTRKRSRLKGFLAKGLQKVSTNLALSEGAAVMVDAMAGRNASQFYFCGKATRDERNRVPTDHPTLKPLELTEHLARLLHQPHAKRIIVPFSGVGSELIGCIRAGWDDVVGLEREPKYVKTAWKRVEAFT